MQKSNSFRNVKDIKNADNSENFNPKEDEYAVENDFVEENF